MADININEVIVNAGAERMLISNCMNNPNLIADYIAEGLAPKHFGIEANRIIFGAITYLTTCNASIDAFSIMNIIKDEKAKKVIEDIGGLEYLLLLQQSPVSPNIRLFINEVIQNYTRRKVYETCVDIQKQMLEAQNKDVDSILGFMNEKTNQIVLDNTKISEAYKMGDKLGDRLQEAANHPKEVIGLPTGWEQFDKITKGLEPGDLVLVCAESKTGKSVTLLNWAKFIAIDLGLPVLYIDAEQSEAEQEYRLASIVSQIPEDEIKTGIFMEDTAYGRANKKIEKLKETQSMLKKSAFFHIYMPEFTLEKIQAVTRQYHLKHGIVALFFDYICFNPTLMAMNKHLRDDMILTNLATGLKNIAGTLGIPVISAAQENRSGYGNTDKDAKNIGGSIGILQKATKLCFLRNKTEEELVTQGANKGNQKFLIKYQRHGDTNKELDIMFDKIRLTQREIQ